LIAVIAEPAALLLRRLPPERVHRAALRRVHRVVDDPLLLLGHLLQLGQHHVLVGDRHRVDGGLHHVGVVVQTGGEIEQQRLVGVGQARQLVLQQPDTAGDARLLLGLLEGDRVLAAAGGRTAVARDVEPTGRAASERDRHRAPPP
jgi:hypothetical protein